MSEQMPASPQLPIATDNPCPLLRGLVSHGHVDAGAEPLRSLSTTVARLLGSEGPGSKPGLRTRALVVAIALAGTAHSLAKLAFTIFRGLRVDHLRRGPLDKRGGGSRIIDLAGGIDEAELARVDEFASDCVDQGGKLERGLRPADIERMVDANFTRPTPKRRAIDRKLMKGEWPMLLRVMAKSDAEGPYLSMAEVEELFRHRRLPARVLAKLP